MCPTGSHAGLVVLLYGCSSPSAPLWIWSDGRWAICTCIPACCGQHIRPAPSAYAALVLPASAHNLNTLRVAHVITVCCAPQLFLCCYWPCSILDTRVVRHFHPICLSVITTTLTQHSVVVSLYGLSTQILLTHLNLYNMLFAWPSKHIYILLHAAHTNLVPLCSPLAAALSKPAGS